MNKVLKLLAFGWLLLTGLCATAQQTQSTTVQINLNQLRQELKAAPMEFSAAAKSTPKTVALPRQDGSQGQFYVVESPMLDPAFAALRPDLKTYAVQSVDDPGLVGRFTLSEHGLNAYLLTQQGPLVVHPVDMHHPHLHKVSLGMEAEDHGGCGTLDPPVSTTGKKPTGSQGTAGAAKSVQSNGATRRTYRFAVVGTGEFYVANGHTLATAQTAVVNSLNAIQAIYDRDMAIRFTVLTPFIYPDPGSDPFVPGPNFDRVSAAANTIALHFNQNAYDIGEVFHNTNVGNPPADLGGGGVAMINSVCNNTPLGNGFFKAGGWSGSFSNTGAGWINLAAHEIGHQFGAFHTFNGTGSFCTAAISGSAAYEIGSGSTIMSYQGICTASQNVPSSGVQDHYFHAFSIQQMLDHVNGAGNCAQTTPTGNTPPVVNANPCGGNYTIPRSTPFTLTGTGVDANGDVIHYTWEQYNEDGPGTPTQGLIGAAAGANPNAPLFRSYPPSPSPVRNFPPLANVIAGTVNPFDVLPSVGRNITFRLTGRDNNPNGGGMHCSELNLTVSPTAGPFEVTAPNGGENWNAGGNVNVTWNVAGTNAFCNNVTIRLSTDGGNTYPFLLAANVPNANGTWSGNIPGGITGTTTARVKVECADNTCVVFYDISNGNFSITSGCAAPTNFICPDDPVTFAQGTGGLNLGLANGFGGPVTTMNISATTASPQYPLTFANVNGNGCVQITTQNHYGVIQFSVDKTGSYDFTRTGFTVMNLFQNSFNPTNSCPTWVASNANQTAGGGASWGNGFTANLTACTNYFIVGSNLFQPSGFNGTVTVTGPGSLRVLNAPPSADYAYTYLAINNATGIIAAVNALSNFTTLAPGTYNVHGASYKAAGATPPNNANPVDFVGLTLVGVYGTGACLQLSGNSKTVTVTPAGGGGGTCNLTSVGLTDIQCNDNGTPNNPADDYLTFKLNPVGTNLGPAYTVTGANLAPSNGNYGAATTFARPAGTLGGGNLNLTVVDNLNNTCQLAFTVNNPTPAPTLGTQTNPSGCNNNDGSVVIGGLTNNQQYQVNYKLNGNPATAGPLTANANGQITLTNLAAGNYSELFVSPTGNGCNGGPLNFNLTATAGPAYTVTGTNPTACGGADGQFVLNGLTANTAYQVGYTYNGNAVPPAAFTSNANGQITVPNLASGAYTNITASLGGCAGAPVTVTLTGPNQPVYTLFIAQPPIFGQSVGAVWIENTITGQVYAVTYDFNGTPTGPFNITSDAIGDLLLYPLNPGSYTNVVATLNGCGNAPMSFTINTPPQNFYQDIDNDGFSDGTIVVDTVPPPGYKPLSALLDTLPDCNDFNPDEFPGQIWWQDLDGDGCGDGTFYVQCNQPPFCYLGQHLIVTVGDCNDLDPTNAPSGVEELCNGIDDNCNGEIDEGEHTYFGNIEFKTQAEIDAFLPCWNYIHGNLTIQGQGITNLSALKNLKEITGNLRIRDTALENLSGLDNLTTVKGIVTISTNVHGPKLSSLHGLEALSFVGKSLAISYNFNLTNCCAIKDLINTPGAVGSLGGNTSIFYNKTGCDNIGQVTLSCTGNTSMLVDGNDLPGLNFQPASSPVEMTLAPNPASDFVAVRWEGAFETGNLKVFDAKGSLVLSTKLDNGSGGITLETGRWERGIYLVTALLDGETFTRKLVLE